METVETRRILPGDCLHACYEDLKQTGPAVRDAPWDWIEAAADLLAQVPDVYQRVAWAILLSERIAIPECPWNLIARHLLARTVTMKGVLDEM